MKMLVRLNDSCYRFTETLGKLDNSHDDISDVNQFQRGLELFPQFA